ncbi:MAG: 2-iminobutanoate/2-iminopropanoate deaminase [Myxococcota bacterium]|jgi:2-iminobutanoate/2-iminopropanoate deaminase
MPGEKEVVRFGPFASAIANCVKKNDTIYMSGQVSLDEKGQVVGEGDLGAQITQAYANVKESLSKLGATMDDIVDETWFVIDVAGVMGDFETSFGARAKAFGGDPQLCQTLIGVKALAMPELMIEIKCVAVV